MRIKTIALLAIAIPLLCGACKNPLVISIAETGSLRVSVPGAKQASKSILPSDMAIVTYRASGSGPSGATIPSTDSSTGSFSFSDVTLGLWTITVDGLDGSSNVIAAGQATTTIEAGATASATVQLSPAAGTGTLSLAASWPTGKMVDEVSGTLTPDGGAASPIAFAVSGTTASNSNSTLASGSYVLVINFKNGGVLVAAPRMETVLVYNGKTSSGSFELSAGDFQAFFVSYDPNGATAGNVPTDTNAYQQGDQVSVAAPGNLAKAGYGFVNWNTVADGSGTSYSAGAMFYISNANVALFAHWSANYTVSFDSQNATSSASPSSKTVTYPATTIDALPTAPTKTGYTFGGWYTAVDGGGTAFTAATAVAGSCTIFAYWIPLSSDKAISSFLLASPAVTGTITESTHSISLILPYGTNREALCPAVTITGATVNPGSGISQNFTNPVSYDVTAADGSTQTYIVTATVYPWGGLGWVPGVFRQALAMASANGKVYLIGGSYYGALDLNTQYDPISGVFTTCGAMPTARSMLTASAVDGKIYAIGGASQNIFATNECYDPSTNSWTTKAPMPTPRYNLCSAVANGKIYVFGGSTGTTLECYDPATDTWASKMDMPIGGYGMSATTINGKIYIAGAGSTYKANQVYDPQNNSWASLPDMPTGRNQLTSFAVGGKFYVLGGYDTGPVECYDTGSGIWTSKTPMPIVGQYIAASVVNDVIYIVNGYCGYNGSQIALYDPSFD